MQAILFEKSLSFHWPTQDPFLFCAHHLDAYPEGNTALEPTVSLAGRQLGQDFDLANDWKMYHGTKVPGFPVHPHRGFETVTIVLEGFVDHFDSGGGSGRYGMGDVQWMTAGAGLQHSEMFPLIQQDQGNLLHLFQVWLNLPQKDKFVEPHYKMLWRESIPQVTLAREMASITQATVIAGSFAGAQAPSPAPNSWAADPANHVEIVLFHIAAGQSVTLQPLSDTVKRSLYFYKGTNLQLRDGEDTGMLKAGNMAAIAPIKLHITALDSDAYVLLLGAEPINEPVAMYGPFVMNTKQEIQQAYADYERTEFGGWPWSRRDPVHALDEGRIARYSDGRSERP